MLLLRALDFQGYRSYPSSLMPDAPGNHLVLRPLTVILGKNGAGKSQVLRLLRQRIAGLLPGASGLLPLEHEGQRFADVPADLFYQRSPGQFHRSTLRWEQDGIAGHLSFTLGPPTPSQPDLRLLTGEWSAGGSPVTLVDSPPSPSPAQARDLQRIWTESVSLGGTRGPIPFQSPRPTGRRRPLGARGEGTVDWLAREPALFGAVRDWLAARLAPSRLDLDDSRDLLELYERDGPARISIRAAAEGVHQLLPVVTLLCARAQESGPWLDLIEQPELHLHDALHGDLGDLLLAAAGLGQAGAVDDGRRLVVETHSEGLLLRIRRRLAEGRVSPDQISLAYVDRTEAGSALRTIALDADGQPDWWPAGVFLERLAEVRAISRALRQRGGA